MKNSDAFVTEGDKFEATYGVDYIKATRLFYDQPLSEFYLNATNITLRDHPNDTLNINGVGVLARVHCIYAHTHKAQCEFHSNPDSNKQDINTKNLKGPNVKNISFSADHAFVLDQSFLELLHAFLVLMIPNKIIISNEQIHKIRSRMLFHVFSRAGRYDLLASLGKTQPPSEFMGADLKESRIASRLLVPMQYIVRHETAHWIYSSISKSVSINDELLGFKKVLEESFRVSLLRATAYRSKQYGPDQAKDAQKQTEEKLNYWLNEGWEEVLCDIQGFKSALITAELAKVPVSSVIVSVNILHMLISAISSLQGEIGETDICTISGSARSLLSQTVGALMLQSFNQKTQEQAAQMHSAANRRFIEQIIKPAYDEISTIKRKIMSSESADLNPRNLVKMHGFGRYSPRDIAIVK